MKAIIITAVLALVAVVAVGYLLIAPTKPTVVMAPPSGLTAINDADDVADWPRQGEATLRELLEQTRSLECTIAYEPTIDEVVRGSYFVADGQLRGDFISLTDGVEVVSSMILSGNDLYTWSEVYGERYGMKVDISTVNFGAENMPDTREPVPLDVSISYDCLAWPDVDSSIFIPPGDVLFQEYSELMERGLESATVFEGDEF